MKVVLIEMQTADLRKGINKKSNSSELLPSHLSFLLPLYHPKDICYSVASRKKRCVKGRKKFPLLPNRASDQTLSSLNVCNLNQWKHNVQPAPFFPLKYHRGATLTAQTLFIPDLQYYWFMRQAFCPYVMAEYKRTSLA